MTLDPTTLTAVFALQLMVLAVALPWVAGWRPSPGLRMGIGAVWSQLLAMLCLWVAGPSHAASWALGAGMVLTVVTSAMVVQAVQAWVGARPLSHPLSHPLSRWVWALPVALALALAGLAGSGRSALWHSAGLATVALAQLWVVVALVWPAPTEAAHHWRWRWMLVPPSALFAVLCLWRASLGLDPGQPVSFITSGHALSLGLLLANVIALLTAIAFLAAWRGEAEASLRAAAATDGLTGLDSRNALEHRGEALIHSARRHAEPLTAVMLDLDPFKRTTDRHGQAQGDASLVLFAQVLRAQLRPGDCAARLGGEAFVALLDRTALSGAVAFDQRLRQALAAAPPQLGWPLDYSAGAALLRPGDRHLHDLLQRADAALYEAKALGRGRLRLETDAEAPAAAPTPEAPAASDAINYPS